MKTDKILMVSAEEIKYLCDFIKEQSSMNREKAETYNNYYSKGLHEGYADAYELCAKWLEKRILEAEKP